MKRICVYCGSNTGAQPEYLESAKALGTLLAQGNIDVVYGGAEVGLMGAVASAALAEGGNVIGIIPKSFADKVCHTKLSELQIVPTMHDRKTRMFDLSDAFITLPGGIGTLEETFEILTWAQIGFHSKPCGLLNINGYFDSIIEFLDHSLRQQFVRQEHRDMVLVDNNPQGLLHQFENYQAPTIRKWIEKN
ncbi:TIGR00730 family Rossman fold protein [Desulfopila sp. IMCC35008]|uniref:LOG family protein n=1 Tax=Desulfopila sp. IMCC35008 TaxID=2653858 RepID=UPI0013D0AE23|nr:TIGR00730 family Rossman fold protein [Desulfopila sp. IMCC35008]